MSDRASSASLNATQPQEKRVDHLMNRKARGPVWAKAGSCSARGLLWAEEGSCFARVVRTEQRGLAQPACNRHELVEKTGLTKKAQHAPLGVVCLQQVQVRVPLVADDLRVRMFVC